MSTFHGATPAHGRLAPVCSALPPARGKLVTRCRTQALQSCASRAPSSQAQPVHGRAVHMQTHARAYGCALVVQTPAVSRDGVPHTPQGPQKATNSWPAS